MTSIELIKVLSKTWANIDDIKLIANCGRDTATNIRNNIIQQITKEGKILPNTKFKVVPMNYLIEYLNLDIEHITNMALMEKSIILQ